MQPCELGSESVAVKFSMHMSLQTSQSAPCHAVLDGITNRRLAMSMEFGLRMSTEHDTLLDSEMPARSLVCAC